MCCITEKFIIITNQDMNLFVEIFVTKHDAVFLL